MDERLRKAKRILSAATGIDRLSEWRVADVNRRAVELDQRRSELISFIAGEDSISDLFAEAMMRRFDQTEKHRIRLTLELTAESDRRLEVRRQLRRAQTLAAQLGSVQRRREEKGFLEEMIEASLQIGMQGPGKFDGSS